MPTTCQALYQVLRINAPFSTVTYGLVEDKDQCTCYEGTLLIQGQWDMARKGNKYSLMYKHFPKELI